MSITHSGVQVRTLDIVQDGDTYYKTTMDEKTGAARAYTGFDANSTIITSVLPGADPSVQSGLNLTQTYLGYYNGAEWKSYMNNDGHFYLGGIDGSLQWNGSSLLIGGDSQLIFGTRIIPGTNILSPDVRLWEETTTPSGMGYWTDGSNPYGPYGSGDESNSIISSLNPFGYQDLVWECSVVSGSEEAGGWAYNTYDIDKTLRYRHTIWAKFIGGIGRDMFFGCGNTGHTSDLTFDDSDSVNNDPYFASGLELPNAIHFNNNPVPNADFELDSNWTTIGAPSVSEQTTYDPHGGTYCYRITTDVPNEGIKSDEFTLEGYTQYKFSIWTLGGTPIIDWKFYIDNGEERYWIKEFGYENNYTEYGNWKLHVVHFLTEKRSTTNRIYILSADDTDSGGTLYVDDISISTNSVVNGDFEEDYDAAETEMTGWGPVGTPTNCKSSTVQVHTGTYSRSITASSAGEGIKTSKLIIVRGLTTGAATDKLIDDSVNFNTNRVEVGDSVTRVADGYSAQITAIESSSGLELNADIFDVSQYYVVQTDRSYIKLMGGYQYRASMWLYGDAVTEWEAKVSDGITDYDFLETDNTPVLVPSGIWTYYELDFEAKNNTEEGYISLTSVTVSGSATIYIDDVEFQETPWYLLTGFLHPDNYGGAISWGDMYHYKSGYSPPTYSGIDYKSLDTTAVQSFRCFQTNSNNDEENKLLLYSPAVHVVDGSEPSLSAILGNSLNMGWNVEHTTSMSRYLLSSPTIRGGNYAGGNYVQLDVYGLRAFGAGVNTFTLDSLTGNVTVTDGTITGGVFQTAELGQRVVIDGLDNTLKFYTDVSDSIAVVEIDNDIFGGYGGMKIVNVGDVSELTFMIPGTIRATNKGQLGVESTIAVQGVHAGDSINQILDGVMGYVIDQSTNTYNKDRRGVYGSAYISDGANNSNAIGVYAKTQNVGTGLEIGALIDSDTTGIRLRQRTTPTDYCDFDVDTSGDLSISPTGVSTYINSSIRIPDGDRFCIINDNTQWALGRNLVSMTTGDIVTGDRFQFITWTGTNDGFQFGPQSGGTPWFEIENGGNINFTGAMYQDAAEIITTAGLQTGIFKTRSYIQFGLDGVVSADDWMHGIGGSDRGEYLIPYACVITSIGIAVNSTMTFGASDTVDVILQKNTGLTSTDWSTATEFELTTADDANFYRTVTGLSASLAAGDRVRLQLDFTAGTPTLEDPIVTVGLLSE